MKQLSILLIFISLTGCNKLMDTKTTLITVDKEFSELSRSVGMNAAFMEYIAEDGIILRSNNMPFVGKKMIGELFKGDDTSFTLTWEPLSAEIAESGELGYTYGTYLLTAGDTEQKGTYVSIWKKDKNGNWKLALDSGNEGLGE